MPPSFRLLTQPMHSHFTRCSLLAVSFAALLTTTAQAQHPQLLTPVANVPAKAHDWLHKKEAIDASIVQTEYVRIDTAALLRQSGPKFQTFSLRLFGKLHVLDFNRTKNVLGYHVLHGTVRGRSGDAIFVVAPNGQTHATIHLVEDSYALAHSTHTDVHLLHRIDDSKLPPHAHPIPVKTVAPDSGGPATPAGGNDTLLDVAMFYTPRALAAAGNATSIQLKCVNSIEQANATNKASKVAAEFRLVYMALTNYAEGTSDLGRFRKTNDGYMDEVHKIRNTFGADLMHLITQPAKLAYCGVAYLMNNVSAGFAQYAFAVTVQSCMNGNVVAHELGHNIGCHHDRNNAGGASYPHSYGFRTTDNKYRTVMAYSPGSRVNVWSSPNVKHLTYTMGKTNSEDNALTIAKTKLTVSNFRAQKAVIFCETIGAIAGKFNQVPKIHGQGTINSTFPPKITISLQWYFANGLLVIGASEINVPYLGGILVPAPQTFAPITASPYPIILDASALKNLPKGSKLWIQALFNDSAAVQGVSATNGMKIVIP